ncbi:hypothetical protein EDD11_000488 [Mortierella claussenii]|nr:hypothetical protein EDD11_000488 [Mortierella claussenii]
MDLQRSVSRPSPTRKQQSHPSHTAHERQTHHNQSYLQLPALLDHDPKVTLKKSGTIAHSSPSRKLSSSNLMRMARQASDTAFRTVGIGKKGSDSNLFAVWKAEQPDNSGVYEQNPKIYLYQHQQLQQASVPPRPPHPDHIPGDWIVNNQTLQSDPRQVNDYQEFSSSHVESENLCQNASLPGMKENCTVDAAGELVSVRAASPGSLLLPGQATNRSHSRPRIQPHSFIKDEPDNPLDTRDPLTALPRDRDHVQNSHASAPGPERSETSLPCSSHTIRSRAAKPRHPRNTHIEQARQMPVASHQALSEGSVTGYVEDRCNKDLPPIPSNMPPPFLLSSIVQPRTESSDEELVLPAPSETLKRNGSSGLIPQDVLKNMDPKDVQKAINATVIKSRVYKVMSSEQTEILEAEQKELTAFIEKMDSSMYIEARVRDASYSLVRLHVDNHNMEGVKSATNQLHTAIRKIDQITLKTQQAMWRLISIQQLLLEHEGAVLNAGLRRLDSENRELSRAVIQLESARGQEKEEKIKWKKEHNRLKFQSIVFPSTPVLDDFVAVNASQTSDMPQVQQQHAIHMASMEKYVKELNDDILHKDEKALELSNKLQAIQDWANDFEWSMHSRKPPVEKVDGPEETTSLQEQLCQLQSHVECELKDMDIQVHDLRCKVDLFADENASLTSSFKALLASSQEPRSESRSPRASMEERGSISKARTSFRTRLRSAPGLDLRMVLHDSLLELDRQIQLEESQSPSTSRPSWSSTCSTTAAPFNAMEDGSDTLLSRTSSGAGRSTSGRSSRSHSSGSNSSLGLSSKALTRDVSLNGAVKTEEQGQTCLSSLEDSEVVRDALKEIQRLNAMVYELKQVARQHGDGRE